MVGFLYIKNSYVNKYRMTSFLLIMDVQKKLVCRNVEHRIILNEIICKMIQLYNSNSNSGMKWFAD